jgi:transcriptional regulator with XRE-family HTH domain
MKTLTPFKLSSAAKNFAETFDANSKNTKAVIAANLIRLRNIYFSKTIWLGNDRKQMEIISQVTGISYGTLIRIESPEENYTIDTLNRVCAFYNMPLKYIFFAKGIDEFIEFENNKGKIRKEAHAKLKNMYAQIEWKQLVFYFDNGVPTMLLTNGIKKRTFPNECTLYFTGSGAFKHFSVSFMKTDKHEMIYHDVVTTKDFYSKGIKQTEKLSNDGLLSPHCSSVLTVSFTPDVNTKLDSIRQFVPSLEKYADGYSFL